MKQISVILLFLVVVLMSCNSSDEEMDVQKPTIENLSIISDSSDSKINTNSKVTVSFKLTDDQALSSWKMDIHDAFDGHAHGKVMSEFSKIQAGVVSGKEVLVEVELEDLPLDATAGQYDCLINATDAAGNSAEFKSISFILRNGTEPQLLLDNENFGNLSPGAEINITGTLQDDRGLISFELILESESEFSPYESDLFDKDFDMNILEFDLSEITGLTVPSDISPGDYHLKFIAKDSDGNYMVEEVELELI